MKQITINLDETKYAGIPKEKLQQAIGGALSLVPVLLEGAKQNTSILDLYHYLGWDSLDQALKDTVRGTLYLPAYKHFGSVGLGVHPFAKFNEARADLDGSTLAYDFKRSFRTENKEEILRSSLTYLNFLDFEELANALFQETVHLYQANREQTALIPIQPALNYQKSINDLQVGKLYKDTGGLDCGELPEEFNELEQVCPACKVESKALIKHLEYDETDIRWCLKCNAIFED